jgi:arylsulfatase A-like enzyme
LREQTLERQKKLGVVPPDTKLAPKPEAIKDWKALSADEKRLFARQMEVFAGFGEYSDTEIGRLIASIKDLGQLDNTLIF